MKPNHTFKFKFALLPLSAAVLALSGCGGESTTDTAQTTIPSTTASYSITGAVPGTLIEAFCDDGSYYQTSSDINQPVTGPDGKTWHQFSLNLPVEVACQLVMTMNEDDPTNKTVTPIALATNTGTAVAIQAVTGGETIDLGSIDLPRDPADLQNRGLDSDGDQIADAPLEHAIEEALENRLQYVYKQEQRLKVDPDGDGLPNWYDKDDDNDGIYDDEDDDDDGDGILDVEEKDSDHDGIEDNYDRDDDNDGLYDDDDDDYRSLPTANSTASLLTPAPVTFTLPTDYVPDTTGGRFLIAQCAQCHGTNGYSVSSIDSLAEEANELREEILEYHIKFNYDIMSAQAKAYTADEASAMQTYMMGLVQQYGALSSDTYSSDNDYDDDRYDD